MLKRFTHLFLIFVFVNIFLIFIGIIGFEKILTSPHFYSAKLQKSLSKILIQNIDARNENHYYSKKDSEELINKIISADNIENNIKSIVKQIEKSPVEKHLQISLYTDANELNPVLNKIAKKIMVKIPECSDEKSSQNKEVICFPVNLTENEKTELIIQELQTQIISKIPGKVQINTQEQPLIQLRDLLQRFLNNSKNIYLILFIILSALIFIQVILELGNPKKIPNTITFTFFYAGLKSLLTSFILFVVPNYLPKINSPLGSEENNIINIFLSILYNDYLIFGSILLIFAFIIYLIQELII